MIGKKKITGKSCRKRSRTLHQRKTIVPALAVLLTASSVLAAPFVLASRGQSRNSANSAAGQSLPATTLTSDEAVVHALDRLAYGPRPGDIAALKQMGLASWIDHQLHPESIDDAAVNKRVAIFPTLAMSTRQILEQFPRPQQAAKRAGMSVADYQKQQQEQQRAAMQALAGNDSQMDVAAQSAPGQDPDLAKGLATDKKDAKREGIPANVMANFQRVHTPQRVVAELAMAKTDRAIYSERQLNEHMVDFWFNHFNVFAGKALDRWLLTSYERDSIRPFAMGKFRDLLEATAKSPAMLVYLDNWQSVDPEAWARLQQERAERGGGMRRFFGLPLADAGAPGTNGMPNPDGAPPPKKQERGLNENYGRELLELHTLGVDSGYTQQDVVEVARAFTGWTVKEPQRDPRFDFNERLHDNKPKQVLGHSINAGGEKDGEQVLDLLARDPRTAHHLSFEIAQEFVADDPPPALVERMAQTYLKTDGDIRAVLRTMIYSPEFWSREAYRAKVKTPFELVVSAARAVDAQVVLPLQLVQWTGRIGEPLYQCVPPTGYSGKAEDWVNTGALLNRLNYSLTLAGNRLRGAGVDAAALLGPDAPGEPSSLLDRAVAALLPGQISAQTRGTLEKQIANPQSLAGAGAGDAVEPGGRVGAGLVAGLVLGAPEFQRR